MFFLLFIEEDAQRFAAVSLCTLELSAAIKFGYLCRFVVRLFIVVSAETASLFTEAVSLICGTFCDRSG